MGELRQITLDPSESSGYATTELDALLGWARKWSLFEYPFVTACFYVPGCPPRPETVIDGLMLRQDKIARDDKTPGVVKPHEDPVAAVDRVVKLRRNEGAET